MFIFLEFEKYENSQNVEIMYACRQTYMRLNMY